MANYFPLTFNAATPRIQELPAGDRLDLQDSAIKNLSVSNTKITGGTNRQALQTNGSGTLAWSSVPSLTRPYVSVTGGTPYAIASDVVQAIGLPVVEFNEGGYNPATSTFTTPITGWYYILGSVILYPLSGAITSCLAMVYKNNVLYRKGSKSGVTATVPLRMLSSQFGFAAKLNAGDTIRIFAIYSKTMSGAYISNLSFLQIMYMTA